MTTEPFEGHAGAGAPTETGLRPDFLQLPERTSKPRRHGASHVLDNGLSLAEMENRLAAGSPSIDIWIRHWNKLETRTLRCL